MAIENKVIAVEQIPCRGLTETGAPAFKKEDAQQVIVKVYEDGTSIPLCLCLAGDGVGIRGRCNSKFLNGYDERNTHMIVSELQRCPYNTFT